MEVSLRDYIDARIKAEELRLDSLLKLMTQHFDLNELAINKAEQAMLVRLETMNEFRAQINQERASYVTKEVLFGTEKALDKRLKILETTNAFSSGKLWMVMVLFAAIPTIIALIALIKDN